MAKLIFTIPDTYGKAWMLQILFYQFDHVVRHFIVSEKLNIRNNKKQRPFFPYFFGSSVFISRPNNYIIISPLVFVFPILTALIFAIGCKP